ncbi:phage antirepressor KilAC domain-containing protein [Hominisplanchenecus sp.]|uniref:phage antirepressor KilAC domain-containing protein n=1 Tax=Hominisplanchenecus sp. TaxID=3038130 RepID=UPI0039920747
MNGLLKINYETEQPTVSARELHEGLEINTRFNDWFSRMTEYGFENGKDFYSKMSKTSETGGRPAVDYQISIDMAKQICMIQRNEKGRQYRQYFLDLEKAWNTPEQIFARALKMADQQIEKLKASNASLVEDIQRMRPKEVFADAVSVSNTCILIGELAKILKQNGVDIGQNRLFTWMRENRFLISRKGTDYNMPTQRSMEAGLFEIKERTINNPDGSVRITKTVLVTGKGQQYFVNKFLNNEK